MWDEVGDHQLFGPDLIKESEEKVKLIRDRLKVPQSRQKSYADSKHKEVVYEIGDKAYLRGAKRFGVKGKLAPRFVGPYRVLERMGEVAYVPTAGKEAKGARATAEGMENEVWFLGLAVLDDPRCASQP